MKTCPNCNAQALEDALFCVNCGSPLTASTPTPENQASNMQPAFESQATSSLGSLAAAAISASDEGGSSGHQSSAVDTGSTPEAKTIFASEQTAGEATPALGEANAAQPAQDEPAPSSEPQAIAAKTADEMQPEAQPNTVSEPVGSVFQPAPVTQPAQDERSPEVVAPAAEAQPTAEAQPGVAAFQPAPEAQTAQGDLPSAVNSQPAAEAQPEAEIQPAAVTQPAAAQPAAEAQPAAVAQPAAAAFQPAPETQPAPAADASSVAPGAAVAGAAVGATVAGAATPTQSSPEMPPASIQQNNQPVQDSYWQYDQQYQQQQQQANPQQQYQQQTYQQQPYQQQQQYQQQQFQQQQFQQQAYQQQQYQQQYQQPYQQPAQQVWPPQTATNRAFGMVLYVSGLLGLIFALCVRDKNDAFITHHLNNVVVILIGSFIGGLLSAVIIGLFLLIYLFVMSIMGIVSAYHGDMKELPLIGKIHIIK